MNGRMDRRLNLGVTLDGLGCHIETHFFWSEIGQTVKVFQRQKSDRWSEIKSFLVFF